MRNNRRAMILSVALVAMFLISIVIGCAPQPQSTPTPTPTSTPAVKKPAEIVINTISDLSGPIATLMAPVMASGEDFWKWYNDQGGIDGVKVRFVWHDTQGDKAKSISAYNKFREDTPKPIMWCSVTGDISEMLAVRAKEDKIVQLTSSATTPSIWPPSWTFGQGLSYDDAAGAALDWISEDWAKKGKTEKGRISCFSPDSASGRSTVSDAFFEYAKTKSNLEIVSSNFHAPTAVDLSSDILKVMQNKPDYLYGFYHGSAGGAFYKSLDSAGYLNKVQIVTLLYAMDQQNAVMAGKERIEGVVGPHFYPTLRPIGEKQESAGVEFVEKLFAQNNRPANFRGTVYAGTVAVWYWMANLVKNGANKVGWDKLDGTSLLNSITQIRDLNNGDISSWGLASSGKRTSSKYRMNQFRDGQLVAITGWKDAPDLRPAQYRTTEFGWTGAGWPAGTK